MIQIGNDKIKEIYVGSIKIKEVYYGSEKVWGGVKGYWVHKDTGVITEFGLDDPNIFKGLLRNPSWRALASEVKLPYGVTGIADSCFAYCTALTSIILPESVTYIGNYCFYNCTSLPSITIPESVTYIGESCFEGCSSLTIATVFPTTPPTLGDIAFLGVHSSFNIKVPSASVDDYKTASGWSAYASIISGIDSYLVDKDNNNIYHFDLSNTPITNFENDSSIATVNGNQILKTYITEIHFGDSYTNVTSIGNYFLGSFENLVTIDLAVLSNVTSIGEYFLGLCTSITSIDLSPLSNLTTIGGGFLSSCYSLSSIDFTPLSNVTTIGINFLSYCEELTTVDLSSLTNLISTGTYFLYYCSKLTTLIMGAITAPTLGSSSLNRTNQLSSIIVPCGSIGSYRNKWYSTQKIDLISEICGPEPGPILPGGLYALGRIDSIGEDYTKRFKHLDYFTENIDEITYGLASYAVISNGKLYT